MMLLRSLILTLVAPALACLVPAGHAGEAAVDVMALLDGRLVKPDIGGFVPESLDRVSPPDYVVFYFSAHWCPSCKKSTPRLVDLYKKQREQHANFELVFVSSDRSEEEMLKYMRGYRMPWLALRFTEKDAVAPVLKQAGRGIPCVIVLDRDGREVASSFEAGKYLGPFKPMQTLAKLLDEKKAQGNLVGARD